MLLPPLSRAEAEGLVARVCHSILRRSPRKPGRAKRVRFQRGDVNPIRGDQLLPFCVSSRSPRPCPFRCQGPCGIRLYRGRERCAAADGTLDRPILFGHYCGVCDRVVQIASRHPDVYRQFRFHHDGSFMTGCEVAEAIENFLRHRHFPHSWYHRCCDHFSDF